MNVSFLFEDNSYTPSSCLLRSSINGSNIYFSEGSGRLYSKLLEIVDKYDQVVIFLDVSPDNINTRDLYNSFYSSIELDDHLSNKVNIIPILCIEFFIVKLISEYSYGSPLDIKRTLSYSSDILKLYKEINGNSLERKLKSLVNGHLSRCFRNVISASERGRRKILFT